MGGMCQGREAVPVRGPALHILIVGAAHILQLAHCAGFVQLLHIQILAGVDGSFHEHIVFAGSLPRLDNVFQLLHGHTHGDGAGAVLACVEHLNRHGRMQRGRNDQMDRIHIRVLQYRFKVGGVVAFVQQVHICQRLQLVRIGIHHNDMLHIRMLQIDGQEAAAETHAHDGNRQLSIFHKITPFML